MSKFEVGQRWKNRRGTVVTIVYIGYSRMAIEVGEEEKGTRIMYTVLLNGSYSSGLSHGNDLVEQVKLQLREGAWYKRADGKVVGPCKASNAREDRQWSVSGFYYLDNGTNTLKNTELLEEVPDPTPKPTFRPFANAAEFVPYRNLWVKSSDPQGSTVCRPVAYDDNFVSFTSNSPIVFNQAFEKFQFEDGTPFGIRVQP
jgi:hypothetical protein